MITRINYIESNFTRLDSYTNKTVPNFRGNVSIAPKPFFKYSERILNMSAIMKRLIYNHVINRGDQNKLKEFYNKIITVPIDSYGFMRYFHNYARKFCNNREVEINLEGNRLLDIAKSDEACIFIMSHENGKKDPAMLGIIGTLLSGAYINLGKAASCPRAKIIVNEDILTCMNKMQRAIYKKFGAVGINANLFDAGKGKNKDKMHKIISEFADNKSHVFIFPEGKMGMFKALDLKYKFQPGIAGIIRSALKQKENVKVIPVGFAYNNKSKNFLGSIYIGKPVCFKQEGDFISVNNANIDLLTATANYKQYFGLNEENQSSVKVISGNGVPIKGREQNLYIAGILCENLKICTNLAKNQVPEKSAGINNVIKI